MQGMEATEAGKKLMQNPQFMEMFQRAMGEGKVPDEKDPNREAWLKKLQKNLQKEQEKEMKQKLEQPVTDPDGTRWMYIHPEPGFCIKCHTNDRQHKVFINICQHKAIGEPFPIDEEIEGVSNSDNDSIKYKVPLSCGAPREDTDKSGKMCHVYDVIVNTNTIKRCGEDSEFRRFVAALAMFWIHEKSEPKMNPDEFTNLNFRAKGKLDVQRVHVKDSAAPATANAMGDEIKLPTNKGAATVPKQNVAGRGAAPVSSSSSSGAAAGGAQQQQKKMVVEVEPETPKASIEVESVGSYDWGGHKKAVKSAYFRETVPEKLVVKCFIPGITTIKEVEVNIEGKSLELRYVDAEDGEEPFLRQVFSYPVIPDPLKAKFVRAKSTLELILKVELPDEEATLTCATRDATEIEAEEERNRKAEEDRTFQEHKVRRDRIEKEEDAVLQQRREMVDNLNAVQEGQLPPSLREEVDKMPPEECRTMLVRLENKIKNNDSLDQLIEKLPDDTLGLLCNALRKKLGLEEVAVKKPQKAPEKAPHHATEPQPTVEYNFAKKAENLFGVKLENRYVFALDF